MEKYNFTKKQRTMIMIPLLIGAFVALLNETLLNVAFPDLVSSLHVSLSTVQWLATAYMLIIGIFVPVTAFLLETFRTKTLYLAAMLIFSAGTVCCGLSQTFAMLLIFRMLQGIGTGMLIPIMMNTILAIYPPEKRGAAIGLSLIAVVVAPAVGPTLSVLVLLHLNWHWLFFFILPFAAAAIVLGAVSLQNVSGLSKPKTDILSVILSTVGFGGLIFGICSIESAGFWNAPVLFSLIGGIGGLILFVLRQLSLPQPMLELRAFRFPMFSLGAAVFLIAFMIPFSANIILPTYLQSSMGLTPFEAGIALMPGGILCGVFTPLSGWLYDRIGAKPPVIAGFSLLIVTTFFLSHLTASTSLIAIIFLHIFTYIGTSLINTPLQTNSLNQLPGNYNPHGVAIINTIQQIAAAFGSSLFIGLMGAVQTNCLSGYDSPTPEQQHAAIVSGVNTAFSAAFILVIIALIASLFIQSKKTEADNRSPADLPDPVQTDA